MADQSANGAAVQNDAGTGQRSRWSGKWAFVLAGAASAVGLGNLWRFPYYAARYGGGTFLLFYILLAVTFGTALLIAETALGRKTGQSVINAFSSLRKKWKFLGVLASIAPLFVAGSYIVISGWVAKYMVAYLTDSAEEIASDGYFTGFIMGNYETFLWAGAVLLLAIFVVALGVNKGIEAINRILMPALIVISLGMAIYAATLPGALEGVAYFLVPDFSKFSAAMLLGVIGQMFFSLSLAMGVMITYGSYCEKSHDLEQSALSIVVFDVAVALLAGFMIIPTAFSALGGAEEVAANAGPSLMFVIMPMIFNSLGPIGTVLGFAFFLLVCFAAFTSLISLCEVCVSIVSDGFRLARGTAIVISGAAIAGLGAFINFGYNDLIWMDPMYALFGIGENGSSQLLDFFDFITSGLILPIVALFTCIFVGYVIRPDVIIEEVEISSKFRSETLFVITVKYVAPVFLVVILVSYTLSTMGIIVI